MSEKYKNTLDPPPYRLKTKDMHINNVNTNAANFYTRKT